MKNERLTLKIETEVLDEIKQKSKSLGLSVSAYVRMVVLKDLKKIACV
jgi:antitoxin component of RelBE/YafQ-DinJ toxin-antitoxin module